MKDLFRQEQLKQTGPGGIKCPCCNDSRGKLKNSHVGKLKIMNKKARKKLKEELRKESYDK